jgi:hypothetical protein
MKPTVLAERVIAELRAFEAESRGDRIVLERRQDGQLWARRRGEERAVFVRRCFPWSEPTDYVSLRDADEKEFALIRSLDELDDASREVLEQALAEAGFVLEITAIASVDEEVEIRNWRVETRQGPRSFQTRLDDWPRQVPSGGTLIRDVAGDLYYVKDPASLDKKSRELLWAFVD